MRKPLRRTARFLVAAFAASFLMRAFAAEVFELEPEYVYGKHRGPRIGYRKPEVFDPLSDQLYQSGFRDYPPTAIPDELKDVDAMTRVQKMGRILACADGWFWPFSRTARKNEAAGIDIELLQSIARKHGWEFDVSWANTGTRFGLGPAFSRTMDKGICDIFLGLTITGEDTDVEAHHMLFTQPYMSTGFVLVTEGQAKGARSLDDIKARGLRIGVPAYSPMHTYLQASGFDCTGFFQNRWVIDALLRHEISAAMLWSGAISQARLEHPEAEFEVAPGYVPMPDVRWNNAWAVKEKETALKKMIDESFAQMLKSGEVKRIVERYGMPFYPPMP